MIIVIILFLLSLLLSSIMPNVLKDFYPFFMIAVIVIVSTFKVSKNKLYISTFLFGIIYDLTYTDLVFFHGFLFSFILYLSFVIIKRINFLTCFLSYYLMIIIYGIIMFLFSFLAFNLSFLNVFNTMLKSLFINSFFFIVLYLAFIKIRCLFCNRKKRRTY